MRTKVIVSIISVLLILGLQMQANQVKEGLKGFVKHLNENQDTLGFNSYGLLEHADKIDVKIYLIKDKVENIKAVLANYEYLDVNYNLEVSSGPDDAIITVTFSKKVKKAAVKTEKKAETAEKTEPKAESSEEAEEKKDCPGRVKVQVVPVAIKTFDIMKRYSLPLAPANETGLTAEYDGTVSEILVENGGAVENGQLIFKLKSDELKKEIAELNVKLKEWKTKLFKRERWKVRSPKAEATAKRIIAETETAIQQKEKQVIGMNLSAPMSGYVFHNLTVDGTVSAGSAVAKIVNSNRMKITIPSEDAQYFSENTVVKVKVDNAVELFNGIVKMGESGLLIMIDNASQALKKGMMAQFKVVKMSVADGKVINSDLVQKDGQGSFVYIVNKKRAQKVYLKIQAEDKGQKETLVKEGLLKEDEIIATNLDCLKDKKKIKIMVLDKESGKLVKRKKVKKTEPTAEREVVAVEKPVEPKKVDKPKKKKKMEQISGNFLKLGLGAGYHSIADSIFSDVYGNGMMSGRFELSYTFSGKYEVFAALDYIAKKGNFTGLKEEVDMTMMPLYLGFKYNFNPKAKLSPFAGLAFTSYSVKEKFESEEVSQTASGPSIIAGANFSLSPKLDIFFHLKYDAVKLKIEALENEELDISGASLFFGASFKFDM